jgi:hypothetical protein
MTAPGNPVIHDSRFCGGKKHQGDGTCRRPAGWGTDHAGEGRCKLHGGCSPGIAKAARERLIERGARMELARLDVAPVEDALTELSKLAGQILAWRDAFAEKVNELTSVRYESEHSGEQLASEIAVFERAMDRCINVLTAIARLKIDERLVKIEQRKVDLVADALTRTLGELGLDGNQQQQARDGLTRHLRLVTG